MKPSYRRGNCSIDSSAAAGEMKGVHLLGRAINRARLLVSASLLLAVLVMSTRPMRAAGLVTVTPTTAQSNGGYLINTYNAGGVQNGLAANLGTIFTLAAGAQTYNISQVITYHYNGGKGAPAGQITIETYQQVPIRTVNAVNSGSVNWVATFNPPLQLPPGLYIVRDSSPSTWSNNGGSAGCLWFNPSFQCGFVRMTGSVTMPPTTPTTFTPGGSSGSTTPSTPYSASRPDLRAWGGCAPYPALPGCKVNIPIVGNNWIFQTLITPTTSIQSVIQQCRFVGGSGVRIVLDASYFYFGNNIDTYARMGCER